MKGGLPVGKQIATLKRSLIALQCMCHARDARANLFYACAFNHANSAKVRHVMLGPYETAILLLHFARTRVY